MGGGGKTTTTKMDPRLETAAVELLGSAKGAYGDGTHTSLGGTSKLGGVADINPLAQKAIGTAATGTYGEEGYQAGTGAYGVYDQSQRDSASLREMANNPGQIKTDLTKGLGLSNFGSNSGGGRNRLSQAGLVNDATNAFAAQKANLLGQAGQTDAGALGLLGQVGQAQQSHNQQKADAPAKALQQYASAFGGARGGFGQSQTTGGK